MPNDGTFEGVPLEYNPYAARYTALVEKASSAEDEKNKWLKQLSWYDSFDGGNASTGLNASKRAVDLLEKELRGIDLELAKHRSLADALKPGANLGWDPRYWFSSERSAKKAELDTHEQALAQLTVRRNKLQQQMLTQNTGTGAGAQVYVDVTAKIAETSDTFSDVCKHRRVGELSNAGTLLANAPIGSTDVLWRVEARAGGTRGYKGQRPFTLTILDVSSVREESAWKRGVPLHGMLCLDGIPEMDIERPASHQFSGRIRLEVNAEQSTVRLTPEQQAALSNSVLNSVALWVRACIGCRVEHLIVVLIDGRVYTRASANAWLESAMKNPTSGGTVALDPQQEKALKQVLQPVQMLIAGDRMNSASTGKELEKYELLPEASKRFLCSLKTSPANQRTVDALRRAACGEHMARGELSRIRVRFRAGPTACGDDQNVIACRSDLELTEYNARDFRFVAPGTSPVIIGTGSLGVDLQHVIAHEMGHWIGLSHIEKGQSLMSSSMESSRCIDTQTVNRLLAQSDGTGEAKLPQAFTMKRRRGPPQ